MSNVFKTFKINKEESDSDFDEVDLSSVFTPSPAASPVRNLPISNVDESDTTPEGIALRASALAAELNLLDRSGPLEGRRALFTNNLEQFRQTESARPIKFANPNISWSGVRATSEVAALMERLTNLGHDVIKSADASAIKQLVDEGLIPDDITPENVDEYMARLVADARTDRDFLKIKTAAEITYTVAARDALLGLTKQELRELLSELSSDYGGLLDIFSYYNDTPGDGGELVDLDSPEAVNYIYRHLRQGSNDIWISSGVDDLSWTSPDQPINTPINEQKRLKMLEKHAALQALLNGDPSVARLTPTGHYLTRGVSVTPKIGVRAALYALLSKKNSKVAEAHAAASQDIEAGSNATKLLEALTRTRHEIIRDKSIEFLNSIGMEFDSIKLDDFDSSTSTSSHLSVQPGFGLEDLIERSWQYLPKQLLSNIRDGLKEKGRTVYYRKMNGTRSMYAIGLVQIASNSPDRFSATLHEQGHGLIEELMPAVGYLEHAFLEHRVEENNGGVFNMMNSNASGFIRDLGDERSFQGTGFSSPYTAKVYNAKEQNSGHGTPGIVQFDPDGRFFEILTTGLEDLFTEPGKYSNPGTLEIATGTGIFTDIVTGAYKDPETGRWYRNASKTEEITPRKITGRADNAGIDTELKGFVLGLLMMMHDWS